MGFDGGWRRSETTTLFVRANRLTRLLNRSIPNKGEPSAFQTMALRLYRSQPIARLIRGLGCALCIFAGDSFFQSIDDSVL
jgi:hypothetical protein